jgi:hypothetical protein
MGLGAAGRMLVYAIQWTFGRVARYSKEHAKRLAEEATRFNISLEKLSAIDNLHHTPVSRNLAEVARLLFLDRVLLGLGVLWLVLMVLLVAESVWIELAGILLVSALAVRINRRLAPRRHLRPGPKQASAAAKIAEILEVPLVVMGHSHVRKDVDLGSSRRYVNTGCWLPPSESPGHTDPAAPCTCKLSHLVVPLQGRPELRVFCKAARTVRLTDFDEVNQPTADLYQPSAAPAALP